MKTYIPLARAILGDRCGDATCVWDIRKTMKSRKPHTNQKSMKGSLNLIKHILSLNPPGESILGDRCGEATYLWDTMKTMKSMKQPKQ